MAKHPVFNIDKRLVHNFTPLKLGTSIGLWDATDINNVTLNGSNVAELIDLSKNNTPLKQTTASKQPIYETDVINGLPAMRFDSTDQRELLTEEPHMGLITDKHISSYVVFRSFTPKVFISDVTFQSGTTVRYTLSGSPDLQYVKNNITSLIVEGCNDAQNNGTFPIVSINDTLKYIDVTNASWDTDESSINATGWVIGNDNRFIFCQERMGSDSGGLTTNFPANRRFRTACNDVGNLERAETNVVSLRRKINNFVLVEYPEGTDLSSAVQNRIAVCSGFANDINNGRLKVNNPAPVFWAEEISSIVWQSGTTVRYTFTTADPSVNLIDWYSLEVSGATNASNNGTFKILTVTSTYLDVVSTRTDATDDEGTTSATGSIPVEIIANPLVQDDTVNERATKGTVTIYNDSNPSCNSAERNDIFTDDNWHFIIFTMTTSPNRVLGMYLDGELVDYSSSLTYTVGLANALDITSNLFMGGADVNNSNFDGYIAELGIFDDFFSNNQIGRLTGYVKRKFAL